MVELEWLRFENDLVLSWEQPDALLGGKWSAEELDLISLAVVEDRDEEGHFTVLGVAKRVQFGDDHDLVSSFNPAILAPRINIDRLWRALLHSEAQIWVECDLGRQGCRVTVWQDLDGFEVEAEIAWRCETVQIEGRSRVDSLGWTAPSL